MYNMEHRFGQALGHGSDTAGVATGSRHKPGRSPFNSFYLFDVDPRLLPHTVDSEIFARILFSRIAFKDILVM